MRLLAALAIEHGLRFLTDSTDGTDARRVIEEDIEIVRTRSDFEIAHRYKQAKKRKVDYTTPGLLLQGSTAMLYLGKHGGYPPGCLVERVFYFPTEAGYLIKTGLRSFGKHQRAEYVWQEKYLRPLLRRLFDKWGDPATLADIKTLKIKPFDGEAGVASGQM